MAEGPGAPLVANLQRIHARINMELVAAARYIPA
jgi:hypothetical protein